MELVPWQEMISHPPMEASVTLTVWLLEDLLPDLLYWPLQEKVSSSGKNMQDKYFWFVAFIVRWKKGPLDLGVMYRVFFLALLSMVWAYNVKKNLRMLFSTDFYAQNSGNNSINAAYTVLFLFVHMSVFVHSVV